MPTVDFAILCDYVRAEGGILHMIAAGIDKINTPVPAAHSFSIALRLILEGDDRARPHDLRLVFRPIDGEPLVDARGTIGSDRAEVTSGEPSYAVVPLQVAVPLPEHGRYLFELFIDNDLLKQIPVTVAEPDTSGGGHAAPDD